MIPLPDDQTLTRQGAELGAARARVLILACGALAREILAIVNANGWTHVALRCLPAIWHNHPERITPAIEEIVQAERANHDAIFVAYADCGTGGQLQAVCARLGVEMIEGPHCYSFFDGNDAFASRVDDEITTFYLTDFLARQFDAFVWKPLGLDRHPQLLDTYFSHYEKLVYLAQTDDPALTDKAADCAARMGLAFERRFTGYGDLATALQSWTPRQG